MRFLRPLPFVLLLLTLPFILAKADLNLHSEEPTTPPARKEKRTSDRGLYITAYTAQSPKSMAYIKNILKTRGLNTVVVDAKESLGREYLPLVRERKLRADSRIVASPWLTRLCEDLHREGYIVTARHVVFKDDHLVIARPDLAVKLPGGAIYRDYKGGRWADPYREEVRLYNALIAESAAASGVDEVQFDYIRFPAEGVAYTLRFPEEDKISRVDIICRYLAEVKKRTDPYNVSLAVDIFGVTAWQSKWDITMLGQSLEAMSKYLDVLSPMFYPSHFHPGYDGHANPGSEPYYFVNTGVKKAREILASAEAKTILVPWIQGFNLASPNYGPNYIRAQINACYDEGVKGFLIWNARNFYDTVPLDLSD